MAASKNYSSPQKFRLELAFTFQYLNDYQTDMTGLQSNKTLFLHQFM